MKRFAIPKPFKSYWGAKNTWVMMTLEPNRVPNIQSFDGIIYAIEKSAWIAFIEVVKPGRGSAKKLIRWFEKFCRGHGVRIIKGEAIEGTQGFWKKLGYRLHGYTKAQPEQSDPGGRQRMSKRLIIPGRA